MTTHASCIASLWVAMSESDLQPYANTSASVRHRVADDDCDQRHRAQGGESQYDQRGD